MHEENHINETSKQALELKVRSYESSDAKLKSTVNSLKSSLTELHAEKDRLEEELRREVLELKSYKKNLERALNDERESKASGIEGLTESHARQIAELEMLMKVSQEKNDEKINAVVIEKNMIMQKSEGKIEELSNKIRDIEDDMNAKNDELLKAHKQITKKDKLYETLKSEFENLEKQYSETSNHKDFIEKENKRLIVISNNLEKSESKLLLEVKNLSSSLEDLKQDIKSYKLTIEELSRSLDDSNKEKKDIEYKLSLTVINMSKLEKDIKILEEEKHKLLESEKNTSKKNDGDFSARDIELVYDEHDKKELTLMNFVVCKVIKYDSKTWCLVYIKNQSPEYNWYEKYFLKGINPSLELPIPYEEQLEQKLDNLNLQLEELNLIKSLPYPEDLKSQPLIETIEKLINFYTPTRKTLPIPFKNFGFEEEVVSAPITSLSPLETYSDNKSECSVQVTAEEANDIFRKMKNLEEENMELENRIMLLNQQLLHFKSEDRSGQFSGRVEASPEQIRGILMTVLETLPLQSAEAEKNIKVILDILSVNKDFQEALLERRRYKGGQEKKSSFKNIFKKKKK